MSTVSVLNDRGDRSWANSPDISLTVATRWAERHGGCGNYELAMVGV